MNVSSHVRWSSHVMAMLARPFRRIKVVMRRVVLPWRRNWGSACGRQRNSARMVSPSATEVVQKQGRSLLCPSIHLAELSDMFDSYLWYWWSILAWLRLRICVWHFHCNCPAECLLTINYSCSNDKFYGPVGDDDGVCVPDTGCFCIILPVDTMTIKCISRQLPVHQFVPFRSQMTAVWHAILMSNVFANTRQGVFSFWQQIPHLKDGYAELVGKIKSVRMAENSVDNKVLCSRL